MGPPLAELFGVPAEALPEMPTPRASWARCGTRAGRSSCLCGHTRRSAGCAGRSRRVIPGRIKATYGTGVFVLAHAGAERPRPTGGLLPTVAWSVRGGAPEWAIDGGVFTAGALLEWLSSDLGLAEDPAALAAAAARPRTPAAPGCCRRSPASARPGGAPTPRRSSPGSRRASAPARSAAPRWRRSPGASPTSSRLCANRSRSMCCASTAASPASRPAPAPGRRCSAYRSSAARSTRPRREPPRWRPWAPASGTRRRRRRARPARRAVRAPAGRRLARDRTRGVARVRRTGRRALGHSLRRARE